MEAVKGLRRIGFTRDMPRSSARSSSVFASAMAAESEAENASTGCGSTVSLLDMGCAGHRMGVKAGSAPSRIIRTAAKKVKS